MPGNIIMVILKLSYQGNFAVFCNAYFLDGLVDQDWRQAWLHIVPLDVGTGRRIFGIRVGGLLPSGLICCLTTREQPSYFRLTTYMTALSIPIQCFLFLEEFFDVLGVVEGSVEVEHDFRHDAELLADPSSEFASEFLDIRLKDGHHCLGLC